jgi:hypothetical protein
MYLNSTWQSKELSVNFSRQLYFYLTALLWLVCALNVILMSVRECLESPT